MKIYVLLSVLFFSPIIIFAQDLTGKALLDKAIQYHDPNDKWNSFNSILYVTMETPNNTNRDSEIHINLPDEYFYVKAIKDTIITEYTINKGECSIVLNGNSNPSEALLKKYNLSCERASMYKNYYTYLYGLPMKLKDPGTIVDQKVVRKNFKGKEYLVLKVTYDENVGSDVWYFYFNPKTYAMEIYQFFKGDPAGIGKDTGEYILLTEEIKNNGIIFPKNRAWYYNKDNKYLGTDILKQK